MQIQWHQGNGHIGDVVILQSVAGHLNRQWGLWAFEQAIIRRQRKEITASMDDKGDYSHGWWRVI